MGVKTQYNAADWSGGAFWASPDLEKRVLARSTAQDRHIPTGYHCLLCDQVFSPVEPYKKCPNSETGGHHLEMLFGE